MNNETETHADWTEFEAEIAFEIEERAAIMEFDGGLTTEDAEREAKQEVYKSLIG